VLPLALGELVSIATAGGFLQRGRGVPYVKLA